MGIKYIKITSRVYHQIKRIRPECCVCGIDIFEHIKKPSVINIWSRPSRGKRIKQCSTLYYCDDCKCDVFNGVRLRKEGNK